MHPLCGALPVPYVPVRVTRGAVIAHRFTYAPPRCRTSQYRRTFIALLVSLWNDLSDPVFDGVGLAGSMVWDWAGPMPFYWPSCSLTFCLLLFSLSILSFCGLVLWGCGLRTDRVLFDLSQLCIANLFLIIIAFDINVSKSVSPFVSVPLLTRSSLPGAATANYPMRPYVILCTTIMNLYK